MLKFNNILKILSLGIGLAIGCILIAKVCFESSYDNFYKGLDRIYLIKAMYSLRGETDENSQVSGGVAPGFKKYVPGVESATRTTFLFESNKFYTEDKALVTGTLVLADTAFFDVFDRKILAGNPKEVLAQRFNIMVSRSFAEKMGGIDKAVGRIIYNEEAPKLKFTIGGVYEDFPENGSLYYDILLSMETYPKESTDNWLGNDRYKGYVKLEEGVTPESIDPAIRKMMDKNLPMEELKNSGYKIWCVLSPFHKLHTSEPYVRNLIIILSVVSFVLVLISLMNYMLISISEMVKRSKEIGIHKCYGAEGTNIYGMLIKETSVYLFFSLLLAFLMILGFRQTIEYLLGVSLETLFIKETMIVLCGVILVLFLVSALLPGYLYNKIPVSVAFMNYKENKRKWKLCLLFIQFIINVFLLSFVFIIAAQYDKALNDDPGYNYDNVLYYNVRGVDKVQASRSVEVISSIPDVVDVERAYTLPFDYCSGNNVYLPGSDSELFNIADQYAGTEGFFEFFDIPIIEGRVPAAENEIAVSRSFVEKMKEFTDWNDGPIGKGIYLTEHSDSSAMNLGTLTISGVYEDYRIGLLNRMDKRPSVRFTGKADNEYMPYILIKVKDINPETINRIQNKLSEVITEKDMEVFSYEQVMNSMYDDNKKMKNTILAGSIFSIAIAFLGLVGYVRDEAQRRSKEIAIRKINGATTAEILSLFVAGIMKWLVVAFIIGDALAYYVAGLWLEQFAEKVSLSLLYFIAADLIVAIIVVATVVICSLKISNANPVLSLKNE
ncbi:ABC transporter permease [Bacteroides sp. ET336]|uniref:ABC transporter permease n=1 Tax=Bacteroides sp. ET336 TaxID=2972459 RepID=UPI0021AD3203|nr:FtsX-like permease family protein [Bacteroides sp. ET336]MCR8893728.1 ABC transporter permease [Bacteroides sp. ET336]MDN0058225.1 ABC transporter permease [Bacteroides caecigallinarum]